VGRGKDEAVIDILALMMWGAGASETARFYRKNRPRWPWYLRLFLAIMWPLCLAFELATWAAEREMNREDEARWPKDSSDEL
jgi:hypothetical protein